jgi:hypothetical protein
MTIEFKGSNAAILPPPDPNQQFNPVLFSQAWMIRRLQVNIDDIVDQGSVQLPYVFNGITRQFTLVVVAERIQLYLPAQREAGWEDEGDMVRRVMHEVLGQFSQMPFSAAGMNFNWIVNWGEHTNSEISRRIFYAEGNPLFRFFNTADACFGAYSSKEYQGTRFRVDAKPVTLAHSNENNTTGIHFNFNFHKELATEDNQLERIRHLLGLWEEVREESSRIMQQINTECGL